MKLIKPILWTLICAFAVFIGFNSVGSTVYIGLFILAAVACACFQWLLYFKNKNGGR